ncbi:MAG: NUDIX domain-containing protein [Acidobacteriota bacterium]
MGGNDGPAGGTRIDDGTGGGLVIGLNAVIVAVTDERPRVLVVRRAGHGLGTPSEPSPYDDLAALPFGPLDPASDRTLELALRRWVREQAGIGVGYVEQLYTFGDQNRDPRERTGGPRVISIGYLTLVREDAAPAQAGSRWRDWYDYLPWEDWRGGRPAVLDDELQPSLLVWCDAASDDAGRRRRRERVDIAFGFGGTPWDGYRVLDRYELLYEAGLVTESKRDRGDDGGEISGRLGWAMGFDHRRILATAIGRLRGKIKYRPVVFELLPETFTLLQLQRVVEALAGQPLHKQNFRRLVEKGGLVEGTGRLASGTGGRPAERFRFRRDVLRERPTPGVGLPSLPSSS